MFEKGDKAIVKEYKEPFSGNDYYYFNEDMVKLSGEVLTIAYEDGYNDGCYFVEENGFCWDKDWILRAVLNNPLNKKLYPDRIEHKGYLVPKNSLIIKEQDDKN